MRAPLLFFGLMLFTSVPAVAFNCRTMVALQGSIPDELLPELLQVLPVKDLKEVDYLVPRLRYVQNKIEADLPNRADWQQEFENLNPVAKRAEALVDAVEYFYLAYHQYRNPSEYGPYFDEVMNAARALAAALALREPLAEHTDPDNLQDSLLLPSFPTPTATFAQVNITRGARRAVDKATSALGDDFDALVNGIRTHGFRQYFQTPGSAKIQSHQNGSYVVRFNGHWFVRIEVISDTEVSVMRVSRHEN